MTTHPPRAISLKAALALCLVSAAHAAAQGPFVLVSDQLAIRKYSVEGVYLGDFLAADSPYAQQPQHMDIGPDGNLYMANYGGGVEVFSLQGEHVRTVQTGSELRQPAFLTFHNDTLVVSSLGTRRVLQYDTLDNDALLPDLVTLPSNLRAPHTVLFRDNGEMLVTVTGNPQQLARFDADGNYLDAFATDAMRRPVQIAATDDGERLLVSNFNPGGGIETFDAETGEHLGAFATDSQQRSDGIHLLPDGSVLVAYHFAQTISRYAQDGTPLGVFADASESLDRPNGIFYVVPAPGAAGTLALGLGSLAGRRRR